MFCANLGATVQPAVISYWQSILTGSATDSLSSIALNGTSGAYIAGSTTSSGAGGADAYIAKYNNSGALEWQTTLGGASAEAFYKVVVDSAGDVYACGDVSSQGAGSSDALIVKYNSSGTVLWQRSLGSATAQNFYGMCLDGSDNIYVVGYSNANTTIFAKYNPSGVLQWQKLISYGSGARYGAIAYSPSTGNVYIAGDLDVGLPLSVASFTPAGTFVWHKRYTVGAPVSGGAFSSIVADASGNLYCMGYLIQASIVNYKLAVVKMSAATGAITWQYYFDSPTVYADISSEIVVASSGNIYISAYSQPSGYVAYIAKLTSLGAITWQRTITSTNGSRANALKVDANETLWAGMMSSDSVNPNMLVTKFTGAGIIGTYGGITYAAATLTRSTGTMTEDSPGITVANGPFTDAARTLTAGTPTFTNTLTTIP